MKEFSIEEKAKRYDEALERAKNTIEVNQAIPDIVECVESLFPELTESGEEEIRKEITEFFKNYNEKGTWKAIPDVKKWIDWLEKQGQIFTQKDIDDAYLKGICDAKHELEKQGNQKSIWHNEDEEPQKDSLILLIMQSGTPIVAKIIEPNHTFNHGERWAYIDDLLEKPADKVEPRFKIGQTIVYKGTENIFPTKMTISDIVEGQYWDDNCCIVPISDQDNWELEKPSTIKSDEESPQTLDEISSVDMNRPIELTIKEWKPSEGQLECLGYAIEKAEKDWSPLTNNRIYVTLKSLKEQLEKLRKE